MSAFSLNDAQRILEAAEKSGLTVDECVQHLKAAGGIKAFKSRLKDDLANWKKEIRTSDERR